jgi:UDP-glucose:(heptosyl)LPS alpha-1,3-glucosyltransferase
MRIALVHLRHSNVGGTERYLNQVAAHLAARGDEVTIVCRSHEEAPHPAVRFVVLRSFAPGAAWRMWAFARDVERHLAVGGYDAVLGLGKTWTHDVIRLGGGCHQTYLDLAHVATRSRWEKVIGRGWVKQRVALAIEARALAPAAYVRVVTNSEMVKRDVGARYAVPAEKIDVIYNGVDLGRFHPDRHRDRAVELRRACGLAPEDFVVLFLGSGYGRKGLDLLLDAFARLVRQVPRACLLVVGYDSAQAAYENKAAQLGIAERTCFLGGRRDAEVCYAAANVYALPTLYDPFANSTLEALATGLPVITTTANGGHEILDGDTGSVLGPQDGATALANELLLWNRRRTDTAIPRGRAEEFSQERAVRATAAVLDRVAEDKLRRANS